MYVLFPVASRSLTDLQKRYADKGGTERGRGQAAAAGRIDSIGQTGKIDYVEPTVSATTDTILLRARIPNPPTFGDQRRARWSSGRWSMGPSSTVLVEGIQPVMALGIPRKAVLSDQQGDYVYVVGADNKVEQRRIQLGQSTPTTAVVAGGLKDGEMVVSDGIQRVRPGRRGQSRAGQPDPPGGPRARESRSMISGVFVDRPRLAIVIAILLTLAGALSLMRIPVSQFPDIVPPQVTVSTSSPAPRPRWWSRPWRSRWRRRSSAWTR